MHFSSTKWTALLATTLALTACNVGENDPSLWERLAPGAGGAGGRGGASAPMSSVGGATSSSVVGSVQAASSSAMSATSAASGAQASSSTGPPPNGPCALTYAVTTVTYAGTFAPKEVGAVWITDGAGQFVQTLEVWGTNRLVNATHWEADSKGVTVDAITGPTELAPQAHNLAWDCRVNGTPVLDGAYFVNEEFTETNSKQNPMKPSQFRQFAFAKGAAPITLTPADDAFFVGQKLTFQ